VWVLDGAPSHSNLLRFALNEDTIRDTTVLLTASMTTPWSIIDQLQAWARILHDHIDGLNLQPDSIKELRARTARRWLEYVEPGDEMDAIKQSSSTSTTSARSSRNLEEELTLPHNTLFRNTGLDIIVVITKVGRDLTRFDKLL